MEVKTKERKVIDEVTIILKPEDFNSPDALPYAHKTLDNIFRDVSNGTIKPQKKDEVSTTDRRRFKVWFNNLTNEEANKIAEYAIKVGIPYNRQFE